jgi:hypothetical protein
VVKVLCFDTLSQVLILNGFTGVAFCILGGPEQQKQKQLTPPEPRVDAAGCGANREIGVPGGFARRLRRTGWSASFMSHDSTKWACCQEKYIEGELLVRTDWELVGRARVTDLGVAADIFGASSSDPPPKARRVVQIC